MYVNNLTLNVFSYHTTSTNNICCWLYSLFDEPKRCLMNISNYSFNAVSIFMIESEKYKYLNLFLCYFDTRSIDIRELENYPLMCFFTHKGPVLSQDEIIGLSKKKINILILRDPYNSVALAMKQTGLREAKIVIKNWLTSAREFVGETNYLKDKILIKYNDWVNSKEYRIKKCNEIGVKYDKYSKVDITGMQYNSSNLDVSFDRWKIFENNKDFCSLVINNKKIVRLSDEIFGKIID